MSRSRYSLRIDVEVAAPTYALAIERVMRLFRRTVRERMRVGVTYLGSYRGSWLAMSRLPKPPEGRVDLSAAKKPRKLRRKKRMTQRKSK